MEALDPRRTDPARDFDACSVALDLLQDHGVAAEAQRDLPLEIETQLVNLGVGRVTTLFRQPYVLKQFLPSPRHQDEWINEHEIIAHLEGTAVSVPRSFGYRSDDSGAAILKEFVPGTFVQEYSAERLEKLADLFSRLHAERVLTRDAHDGNVIVTDAGDLMFIDFGKSHIFGSRGLRYWMTLTRELFFIHTRMLQSKALYRSFQRTYMARQRPGARFILKLLLPISHGILGARRVLRERRRARRMNRS